MTVITTVITMVITIIRMKVIITIIVEAVTFVARRLVVMVMSLMKILVVVEVDLFAEVDQSAMETTVVVVVARIIVCGETGTTTVTISITIVVKVASGIEAEVEAVEGVVLHVIVIKVIIYFCSKVLLGSPYARSELPLCLQIPKHFFSLVSCPV